MSNRLVTAEPLRPSYRSFLKIAAEGSPPTPKSCVRTPRMLTASIKLSWLLPVMPGVNEIRSLMSLRFTDSVKVPDSAVIASGTSCTVCSRLVAVTMTSSICCAHDVDVNAVAITAVDTALATAEGFG